MAMTRIHFKLSTIILGMTSLSLLFAYLVRPSWPAYLVIGIIQCQLIAVIAKIEWNKPIRFGAICGVIWFNANFVYMIAERLLSNRLYQGQLYHEDGPEVFFLVSFLFLLAGSIAGTVIGSFTGVCTNFLFVKVLKLQYHFESQ